MTTASPSQTSGSWLDALGGFADRAAGVYTQIQQARAANKAALSPSQPNDPSMAPRAGYGPTSGSMPKWVWGALAGGLVLVLVLVVRRK
jgi:hypothetical protein